MKFVIAPDKFKGALSGAEFCNAVEQGIKSAMPNAFIIKKPLADGGDGTIQVVKDYLNAEEVFAQVHNPVFKKIKASYLFAKQQKVAFIELSEASGYKLLAKNELNCMQTTSLGTGELVLDAIKKGAQEIILGIGGSATNDGGMGIAVALGYVFLDKEGNVLKPVGENLSKVHQIQKNTADKILKEVKVRVACDVTNPFYGAMGAAHVYARQKGASQEDILLLDKGLRNFAKVMASDFGVQVQKIKGAGAAGGIGGGAAAFLGAELVSGIELIKEIADFDNAIEGADWIITGEGKLDEQTLSGKTIHGVLESAKAKGISVAAFCGRVDLSNEIAKKMGLDYIISVSEGMPNLEAALKASYENLKKAAFNFVIGFC